MPENPYAFPQPFIRTPGDGQFESANQAGEMKAGRLLEPPKEARRG